MNRRLFLKSSGSVLGLSVANQFLGSSMSWAQNLGDEKQFLVLIRIKSGWDVTLSLDPKVHQGTTQSDIFIEYKPEEILKVGNLGFGPAFAPMMPFAQDFSVINGIMMNDSDNGHEASLKYMTAGASDIQTDLVVELQHSSSLLKGDIATNTSLSLGNRNPTLTSLAGLSQMTKLPDMLQFQNFLSSSKSKGAVYQAQQNYLKNSKKFSDLKAGVLATDKKSSSGEIKMEDVQLHYLKDCFKADTARVAELDISKNLDTHGNHPGTHMKEQSAAWEKVAELMKILKSTSLDEISGLSIYDRTTFMVISEFSRTPALNAAQGKDHNPLTNSVLIGGYRVQPNVSFGQSQIIPRTNIFEPMHTGLPLNFPTNQAAANLQMAQSADFNFVTPENVAATLARIVHADLSKFKSVSAQTLPIQQLIKS